LDKGGACGLYAARGGGGRGVGGGLRGGGGTMWLGEVKLVGGGDWRGSWGVAVRFEGGGVKWVD